MEAFLFLMFFQMLVALFFMGLTYRFLQENKYLGLILSAACIAVFSKILLIRFLSEYDISASISFSLGFSALLYFYIREVLTLKKVSNRVILVHSIPFILSVIWFTLGVTAKVGQWDRLNEVLVDSVPVFSNVRYVIISLYVILDIGLIYRFRKRFISLNKKANYYLIILSLSSLVLLLAVLFYSVIIPVNDRSLITFIGLSQAPFVSLVIMYYKIIVPFKRQRHKLHLLKKSQQKAPVNKPKYVKSNVTQDIVQTQKKIIVDYLKQDKAYLDLDFSFEDLCKATGLTKHEVSFILNQHLNGNFYQVINSLRVDYFIEHIQSVILKEQTILSLAYQSGFNSKSTFNKYFKQVTLVSPSEYVAQLSKSVEV